MRHPRVSRGSTRSCSRICAASSSRLRRDAYLAARLELAIRLAEHLRRAERFGPAHAAAELDDLGELLGQRPASVLEGQRALERGVREWGARREAELVRYFHRHAVREEALMRGALGLAEGRSLSPVA